MTPPINRSSCCGAEFTDYTSDGFHFQCSKCGKLDEQTFVAPVQEKGEEKELTRLPELPLMDRVTEYMRKQGIEDDDHFGAEELADFISDFAFHEIARARSEGVEAAKKAISSVEEYYKDEQPNGDCAVYLKQDDVQDALSRLNSLIKE